VSSLSGGENREKSLTGMAHDPEGNVRKAPTSERSVLAGETETEFRFRTASEDTLISFTDLGMLPSSRKDFRNHDEWLSERSSDSFFIKVRTCHRSHNEIIDSTQTKETQKADFPNLDRTGILTSGGT